MFGKVSKLNFSKKNFKLIALLAVVIIVILILVGNIYSALDNRYVIDVVKDTATTETTRADGTVVHDDNVQLTERILKKGNEFNAIQLDYEVTVKNIAQDENVETQVAVVIDTSYSMGVNDVSTVVKPKVNELVNTILTDVNKSRVKIVNNTTDTSTNWTNYNYNNSGNSIETVKNNLSNFVNNTLVDGVGNDSNLGLISANNFTTPLKSGDKVNKYIIVFTDSTDDVADTMKGIPSDVQVISILTDMTSTGYVTNDVPVNGEVYLLLSELAEADVQDSLTDNVKLLDMNEICASINKLTQDIVVHNTFSEDILEYFDVTDFVAVDETVVPNQSGYEWTINDLKFAETATLNFKVTLKARKEVANDKIFEEICTNEEQYLTYKTYNKVNSGNIATQSNKRAISDEMRIEGTDERAETESTVIKICQGYDLNIRAVSEENPDTVIKSGIKFEVEAMKRGVNGNWETLTTLEPKEVDSNGFVKITAEEASALRADGEICFIVRPIVDANGYSATDKVSFVVHNLKERNQDNKSLIFTLDFPNDLRHTVIEEKRIIQVDVPIETQKFFFDVKVQELNKDNVVIEGSKFYLLEQKQNVSATWNELEGVSDSNGMIRFEATVRPKGTYTYILRQEKAPTGYNITPMTLVTIEFDEDGNVKKDPVVQMNANASGEKISNENVLITIKNENIEKEEFNLKINVEDIADNSRLEGATYQVKILNSNNEVIHNGSHVTDTNGKITVPIRASGNVNIQIIEQAPKAGYIADTKIKTINATRSNGITVLTKVDPSNLSAYNDPDDIEVNLYSQKKSEQNILKVELVDLQEQDVPVGSDVVYELIDTETGESTRAVSNKNGELLFALRSKAQGAHTYRLSVDKSTIPSEYDDTQVENNIDFYLNFDQNEYLVEGTAGINVTNGNTVVGQDVEIIYQSEITQYTAVIKVGYSMKQGISTPFIVQLIDADNLTNKLEGAKYNIDIEWDVNGFTKTKSITGRRTNTDGQIITNIIKGDIVRVSVTQIEAKIGYGADLVTQEIELRFNNNGTVSITQAPYGDGDQIDSTNRGAYIDNDGSIVYQHTNKVRTTEDTYLNLTIYKQDRNGMPVNGRMLNIKSSELVDKDGNPLNLMIETGSQDMNGSQISGGVTVNFSSYINNVPTFDDIIRVPGIGEANDAKVYTLEVSEMDLVDPATSTYKVRPGTTVAYRLQFKYRNGRVDLTACEIFTGMRLEVEKPTFSSGSETEADSLVENGKGVYLANVTSKLYTDYDEGGNLCLDFKKVNKEGQELSGAQYEYQVKHPDGSGIRKRIDVDNDVMEITGANVSKDSYIFLREITAPVGYGISEDTEEFKVKEITADGEIILERHDASTDRAEITNKEVTVMSDGTVKTTYEITLKDYELDTFDFEITAKDSSSQKGVEGYGFSIKTNRGAKNTLITGENGNGATKVGGSAKGEAITYTVSMVKVPEFYKKITDNIEVIVVFDENGNVDPQETRQSNQLQQGYGTLWEIIELDGKIGIQILVEHLEPLIVKVNTLDKITNDNIAQVEYKVTESEELPATGSNTIEVGYVIENGTKTYILSQTKVKDSYSKLSDIQFALDYVNGIVENPQLKGGASDNDTIMVTGDREVTITVYVEPKVPFEITNLYYFDHSVKLQGANFEVVSQRNQDKGTGTTDQDGMTGIYSDVFGYSENDEVLYKVGQTKGADGYSTVDDFYVKVIYNTNREIKDVKLTDQYGQEITNNRFVTVSFDTTSTYSNYNNNNKGIVKIQVLNYPEFKFVIKDFDRRDGMTVIAGTQYSVTSTYEDSDNNVIDFMKTSKNAETNSSGFAVANLDRTRDNTVVTYTIKEERPGANYQSLGAEIKVKVTFDANGFVSTDADKAPKIVDDTILSKIASVSAKDSSTITDDRDRFIVNLELKNNPILKFNITKIDDKDKTTRINGVGFTIVSKIDDKVYSNSSATSQVNQSDKPEMSTLTGRTVEGTPGYTNLFLDRTVDNSSMYYTIKEDQKAFGYEWAGDVILKIDYDQNGKISSIAPTQGASQINLLPYDADNFEVNIEIYNVEIEQFGIHLSAVDTYDVNKKINDVKVDAYLTQEGTYTPDEKYSLMHKNGNGLLTGADRNNDGNPDLAYGEDVKYIGKYSEGRGTETRTLRLEIQNRKSTNGGDLQGKYLLDDNGTNIGYYKGTDYYPDAKYQVVKYSYLISVTFSDDGKIIGTKLLTGRNDHIGYLVDDRYVQIEADENNQIEHSDYMLNLTLKFFPLLDLKLNAMDNYTWKDNTNNDGIPVKLDGARYLISTQRHIQGTQRQLDELISAGCVGEVSSYGGAGATANALPYEAVDELFVPIDNNTSRLFYVFEEAEPTNYQKYTDWHQIHYRQRLVAVIKVSFDQYGNIKYDDSIVRQVNGDIIHPYMDEDNTTYLSSNNIKEYNYYCTHKDEQKVLDFYIGYALTTKINVTAIDDISGKELSNIKMYPFINTNIPQPDNNYGVCLTNLSYDYSTTAYRNTDNKGKFSTAYWGAATDKGLINTYIIGSQRQGNDYNGYLFPSDMSNPSLGGSGKEADYYAKIDVKYDDKGRITDVSSASNDLWGTKNVSQKEITFDPQTGNVYIKMLFSRKLQMSIYKVDEYDKTINKLSAGFRVTSEEKKINAVINSKLSSDVSEGLVPIGKVYKGETVKYTIVETREPNGYYPIRDQINFEVKFDINGDIINKNSIKTDKPDLFEVMSTSDTTEKTNKTEPDIAINIKNKPAFNLNLRVIDKFYKNDGVSDIDLKVTNNKDNIEVMKTTDSNGYANLMTGPIYPGETVEYHITQENDRMPDYYPNTTEITLRVEFSNTGKVLNYSLISGGEVVYNFSPSAYLNEKYVALQIMNMPHDLKIGINKFDQLTNETMDGVKFKLIKEVVGTSVKEEISPITTVNNGNVIATIDAFSTSTQGKSVKYTIHEEEVPQTYRKMQDVVILVEYNSDGSIKSWRKTVNDDGILNGDVNVQVAMGTIKKLNDERVHLIAQIPNDNAYDLIIKNEDTNVTGFGIQGSQFDVSINGEAYPILTTDVNGIAKHTKLTHSGDITINIAQRKVGEGYRDDLDNNVEVKLVKGVNEYTLDLNTTTAGYQDNENAVTAKAIIKVDEEHGTITVTFKNETKLEMTVVKQDRRTKQALQGAEFEITAQQVDVDGNEIGNSVTLTTDNNKVTDIDGRLYFDLGVAPRSEIWLYTFKEKVAPADYNLIADITMKVRFDQNGRIQEQISSKTSRLLPTKEHNNDNNCRSMYIPIYNGVIPPSYTLKVYTRDAKTGSAISGAKVKMDVTKEDGSHIEVRPDTVASTQNGGTGITGNLGIDGVMYSDEQIDDPNVVTPVITDKGLVYIDNIDYEGTINIMISETEAAPGYVFGNNRYDTINGIKIKAEYVYDPTLVKEDPVVNFEILDRDGFGETELIVDDINREITVIIKNESRIMFDILTTEYKSKSDKPTVYIPNVSYDITSEIQYVSSSVSTGVSEKTPLSDANGRTKKTVGQSYPGQIVVYTLHQNVPQGYKPIDDIKIEVHYDSRGYIKSVETGGVELLTSEDNARIDEDNTNLRTISLVVQNRRHVEGYKIYLEKHAADTDEDIGAYLTTVIPDVKFRITVDQQYNGDKLTQWTDITDKKGLITRDIPFYGNGIIDILIEELEVPEGYAKMEETLKFRLFRDPDTGEFDKDYGNVNLDDIDMSELDDKGNVLIKVKPYNFQAKNKFTLILNKNSNLTGKRVTTDTAEFKAEIIGKDTNGNIIYQDSIDKLITDENGKATKAGINIPTEDGNYELVINEIKAPDKYIAYPNEIRLPLTFNKDKDGNNIISGIPQEAIDEIENVSISAIKDQVIGINIGNDVDDPIEKDEYSLDITKVDATTGQPIEDSALFKVKIPDDYKTEVYTPTGDNLLGSGKLDYCYINQDGDFTARLTHMKKPEEECVLTYVFTEVLPPEGYAKIERSVQLDIEFKKDEATGELYIASVTPKQGDEDYIKVKTQTPCSTDTRLVVDIVNNIAEQTEFKVHYEPNYDGATSEDVPADQIKHKGEPLTLTTQQPIRTDYIFVGWGTLPTSTTPDFAPGAIYELDQDITLYAIWRKSDSVITYDKNCTDDVTNMSDPQTKPLDTPLNLSDMVPEREGYVFDGWSTVSNATESEYQPEDEFTKNENTTLYAVWVEKLYLTSTEYQILNAEMQILNAITGRQKIVYDKTQLSEYNDGDRFITGILPQVSTPALRPEQKGTTVEKLIDNLSTNADSIKIYKKVWNNQKIEEVEVAQTEVVATAMRIELKKGVRQSINLELAVAGDVYSSKVKTDVDAQGKEVVVSGDGVLLQNDQNMISTQSNFKAEMLSRSGMVFVVALDINLDGDIAPKNASIYKDVVPRRSTKLIRDLFPW